MTYEYDKQDNVVNEFTGPATPDENGRPMPYHMSMREMTEEMLLNSRKVTDLVNGFFDDFKSGKINPMQMMTGLFKR